MAAVDVDAFQWYEAIPQFSKILAASWLFLAAPGCSWLLLAAPGCSRQLLAAPGFPKHASGSLQKMIHKTSKTYRKKIPKRVQERVQNDPKKDPKKGLQK